MKLTGLTARGNTPGEAIRLTKKTVKFLEETNRGIRVSSAYSRVDFNRKILAAQKAVVAAKSLVGVLYGLRAKHCPK